MVAAANAEKLKVFSGKKVSKPLMEKKRRARINKCLDQLRTLLETCYSNNIRKRKLEKADILELTVRHLRHLQKNHSGMSMNSDFAEYQAGFRSCLAGVNQYLLMTDIGRSNRSDMLTQLSSRLPRSDAHNENSSTLDSDLQNGKSADVGAQRLTTNMAVQASPAAVSSCIRRPNANRNHGNPAKTITSNGKDKDSFPGASQAGVIAPKRLKEDCSTDYSSRGSYSTEGQCNVKHITPPCDPYWRPW
ncbi:hypothetical protein ACEWY4_000365 [Coilia grayii]|uniref:BHLH domain-containing protein n=1 Tax=Coilia grayii TaxID=363190 RepID=A0ABD1KWH1_9TELE